ncbi:MAG: hypothetical protein ACOY5R_07930 [Pseudomonadota bacterium]|jgi:hypothetical protein
MIELPRQAKGDRPIYLGDKTTDNLLSMLLALAGEVVVLRERLDSVERIVSEDDSLKAKVDAYRPSPDVEKERDAWRAQFLDIVLRPLKQDYEDLESRSGAKGYDEAIEIVTAVD